MSKKELWKYPARRAAAISLPMLNIFFHFQNSVGDHNCKNDNNHDDDDNSNNNIIVLMIKNRNGK